MPRIRITDLLWDVNALTGFLDAFTDLRSGRVHSNPAALLAAILAGATNLGLERMARASSGVSQAQLSWASAWYLRSETYADALARVIDAHHALPFASVWGSASRTSSDGQFFASGRNAGEINSKYGPDPGLKIYSFLSGRYGSFHSNVIGATAGEAPFVLDGLVGNAALFDPLHVDTGGVSDHVFALFHLLGLSFAPRLRDFPDRRLACFGRPGRWKELAPLMGKPINEEVVLEHWGCWPPWRPHRALAPMNKDAQGRWKVGMSNTKLKMRVQMFGDRFSSSTSCSGWLHETSPGRPDQSLPCRFLKVATHP